jgi:hypothetical protein
MNECKVLSDLSLDCPNLEKLALSGPRMTFNSDYAQDLGARCPKIHMLSLSNVPVDDQALSHISGWNTLRALVISNCERLVNPVIRNNADLKGLQVIDCSNLESPVVDCSKLIKMFYRNCPKLKSEALSLHGCNDLKFLEVLNCASIEHVRFASASCQAIQLGSCHGLTSMELVTPNLGKITITDAPNLRDWRFAQVAPRLVEVVLEKCSISDESLSAVSQMTPHVQSCHVKQCPALREPTIAWSHLRMIDFLECAGLVLPRLNPNLPQTTVSFKVCPRLNFQDFSAVSSNIEFLEIVSCEGLVSKVRFPLFGLTRLNIALCHKLGAIELYGNPTVGSKLEKLLITHCRDLRAMKVEANNKPILAQLKDCPHLAPPVLDPPARVMARMMGCFNLGCQGPNMLERVFGGTGTQFQTPQQQMHPMMQMQQQQQPNVQMARPAMPFPHPMMMQRGMPFPQMMQQGVGGFPIQQGMPRRPQ